MATQDLKLSAEHREYIGAVTLTDTTATNLIGNRAGSGALIMVRVFAFKPDSGADTLLTLQLRDQDGVPICDERGDGLVTGVTPATDTVAGADLGGPYQWPKPGVTTSASPAAIGSSRPLASR